MKKSKLNPTAPQVEVHNKNNLRVQNKVPADEDCKFVRRNSWNSRQGDENIQFQSNEGIDQNALTKRMEKYTISLPHLKETKVGITLEQIYASSRLKKRDIISCQKREDSLQRKNLHSSEERIQFFKRELQKNRISFMEDSITLVIDRNNIVKDTINQISSTDRFSFYKEVKIFFVGEEAQDAGGVLKEWIFYLIQTILSTPNEINFREEFAQTRNNRKLLRSKSLTDSKEESKRKINENASFRNGSPDSNSSRVRFPKSKLSSKSAHFGESEESELLDSVKGRGRSNVEICKSGDEVYYHLKSTGSLKICKLLGQIVGKAIFEDIPLEPKFTDFMLK
mmetsp:Transcript_1438/g.1385  ORF Transcript_1438/g.1385 Transcript_1438/m.1385 type:complete len:338 (-) Transcript_1438:740-1753(-)